jgi:hypothetical protein
MPRRQLLARQPVWLTGGEFVDQRAQPAPGHASKVRVDRLQGRRQLVTQRAQPMKLPMSSRT